MEQLMDLYRQMLRHVDTTFVRFMHESVEWSARMIGIVGPRGVGKTTMLLQHIKQNLPEEKTLFVNADDLYFEEHRLFDLAKEFYQDGGKHLFIDEVHKYPDWSKELKMMYDYMPDFQIVFTGSSILDIYRGQADLSRRALTYYLPGLSFREYLQLGHSLSLPSYSLDDILAHKVDFPSGERPLALFHEYLKHGYYPFFKEPGYEMRLRSVVLQTVENDIPTYSHMTAASTKKIRQLLYVIAQSVPMKPNYSKIGQMIDLNRNQVADYMYYLERAGIIAQLRPDTGGIRMLGKTEKVYLDNTNLAYALTDTKPDIGNLRETFFLSQMKVNQEVLSSDKSDFRIGGYTFEVGEKGKQQKQIRGIENAFVVKDDIEWGHGNVIPLWQIGMNY